MTKRATAPATPDPVAIAMQTIATVLRLLSDEDRRIVVQATYNVEMQKIGDDQLLQAARVGEGWWKRSSGRGN